MTERAYQLCINPVCATTVGVTEPKVSCPKCGSLLEIRYDWDKLPVPKSLAYFEHRWSTKGTEVEGRLDFSGVWRFRELFPFYRTEEDVVTIGEGRTMLQQADILARNLGMHPRALYLQYEGLNPSGSFKDNGMTAAFTHAKMVGAKKVACASTGNTSASLAMFASLAEIQGIVFIGSGKIAFGKLSQALDYGALTLQIQGDFDACLRRVRQIAAELPELGIYLMNSVNPFRLEGQKSIMLRILEAMSWEVPDWIIVPGGNLGNCSAFGKVFAEMKELGLVKKIPRLAVINAAGANTLHQLYNDRGLRWNDGYVNCEVIGQFYGEMNEGNIRAHTVASAIEIGRPVNLPKALKALDVMNGVTRQVTDDEILAGLQKLLADGTINKDDRVACILTGHELKDANVTVKYHTGIDMKAAQDLAPRSEPHGTLSNRPVAVADRLEAIIEALGGDPALAAKIKIDPDKVSGGAEH
jgi:threonine synthase